MKKDKIVKKIVIVRGSPGRKQRLLWEPRLTVWEPLSYQIRLVYVRVTIFWPSKTRTLFGFLRSRNGSCLLNLGVIWF